jgi:hypothetical protein
MPFKYGNVINRSLPVKFLTVCLFLLCPLCIRFSLEISILVNILRLELSPCSNLPVPGFHRQIEVRNISEDFRVEILTVKSHTGKDIEQMKMDISMAV